MVIELHMWAPGCIRLDQKTEVPEQDMGERVGKELEVSGGFMALIKGQESE